MPELNYERMEEKSNRIRWFNHVLDKEGSLFPSPLIVLSSDKKKLLTKELFREVLKLKRPEITLISSS